MQITIVVDDKLVLVGGKPIQIPELDWSVFDMDPANPDDDIAAVQFDTDAGIGHVEFKTRLTKQATRPNIRPPDWLITTADFEKHFGFVLPAYEERARQIATEAAKREAEAAERAVNAPDAPPAPALPDNLATKEDTEKMIREAIARFGAEIIKTGA